MKEINLIGLVGKKQNGKSTVADVIQFLTSHYGNSGNFSDYIKYKHHEGKYFSEYEIKSFAGKLKQIVSLLIGCNISDLESEEFKNKPLGEEWNKYKTPNGFISVEEHNNLHKNQQDWCELIKLTPRILLQLTGTQYGRDLIHPNLWVNSLFSDYRPERNKSYNEEDFEIMVNGFSDVKIIYPKWIISDVRYLNEVEAIKSRDGIVIQITNPRTISIDSHESENALSEHNDFDYHILNDSSIEDLVVKVKQMLQHFEIIK